LIKFYSPREIITYEPPRNQLLVGDYHICRGEIFVIGGPPGVGKSRAVTSLACSGVTGDAWFGEPIHTPFKTMIIQNENGLTRLMREYSDWENIDAAREMVRVSEPPPYGLSFTDEAFRKELLSEIQSFRPDVIVIDPWNAVAKDDNIREYTAAFDSILAALPAGEEKPAIGIVAHTRKPKPEEKRIGGHQMMNLLAGSYIISSKPRSVFIMLPANELDETDRKRIWFNPKNNNGKESVRSVWECSDGKFRRVRDFNWEKFAQGPAARETMSEGFVLEALHEPVDRKAALERMMTVSGLGKRACEKALEEKGKFSHLFVVTDDGYYLLK
jgi:hypothetical protein